MVETQTVTPTELVVVVPAVLVWYHQAQDLVLLLQAALDILGQLLQQHTPAEDLTIQFLGVCLERLLGLLVLPAEAMVVKQVLAGLIAVARAVPVEMVWLY
jgi:hypothetical protein